jgi:hypothetical protein
LCLTFFLDRKSLFPPPVNFREILKDTRAKEPILILIGSGADPSQELRELAETTVGSKKYYEVRKQRKLESRNSRFEKYP